MWLKYAVPMQALQARSSICTFVYNPKSQFFGIETKKHRDRLKAPMTKSPLFLLIWVKVTSTPKLVPPRAQGCSGCSYLTSVRHGRHIQERTTPGTTTGLLLFSHSSFLTGCSSAVGWAIVWHEVHMWASSGDTARTDRNSDTKLMYSLYWLY